MPHADALAFSAREAVKTGGKLPMGIQFPPPVVPSNLPAPCT
jgi:hypothetical protein